MAYSPEQPYSGQFSGQTKYTYQDLLKIWYSNLWENAFKEANMIWNKLGKTKSTMGGKYVQAAVVTSPPQSAGIWLRPDRAGLPTQRVGTQALPILHARDVYTSLGWSGAAERAAAAGDKAAFAKPRQLDMKNARLQADINNCLAVYEGYYQPRGVVSAYNAGTLTATLYGRNDRTSSGEAFWYTGNFKLRPNQSVGFANAVSGAPTYDIEGGSTGVVNEVYIASLGGTDAAPTIVLSGAPSVAPAADDIILPFKSRALTGYASAAADTMLYAGINGVSQLNTDSTIYGAAYDLDRTTAANAFLNGYYNTGSGTPRAYTERRITLASDAIRDSQHNNGKAPNLSVMHSSTRREHLAEHNGDQRYAPIQTEQGYGKLVQHIGDTGIPIESDWLFPPGAVALFSTDVWGWVQQSRLGPLDLSAERWIPNFDQNVMYWHMSGNLECQVPSRQGWVDDLDGDVYALLGE